MNYKKHIILQECVLLGKFEELSFDILIAGSMGVCVASVLVAFNPLYNPPNVDFSEYYHMIITISREFGSGRRTIGKQFAGKRFLGMLNKKTMQVVRLITCIILLEKSAGHDTIIIKKSGEQL